MEKFIKTLTLIQLIKDDSKLIEAWQDYKNFLDITDGSELTHKTMESIFNAIEVELETRGLELIKQTWVKPNDKNKLYERCLANFLTHDGYQADTAKKIAKAYFKKPTGSLRRAANTIKDFDDEDHDYTQELIEKLIRWQQRIY